MTFDAGEGSFADDSKEKVESVRPGHLLKTKFEAILGKEERTREVIA